jgi:adenylate cyclase
MVAKVFLIIGLVVGSALLLQAREDVGRIETAMRDETRDSASGLAKAVMGSLEHAMLAGDGIQVKQLLGAIKGRLPRADIHVYDPRGVEVFGRPQPAPAPTSLPAPVLAALTDANRKVGPAGEVYRPIPSDERCVPCHPDGAGLRGVLELELAPEVCADRRDEIVTGLIADGFVHVMSARRAEQLDAYFAELRARAPSVRGVAVFDADGDRVWGEPLAVAPEAVAGQLTAGASPRRIPDQGGSIELWPLPMQPRCVECHPDSGPVRGLLAVSLAGSPSPGGCAADELEAVIDTSVRYIMLSQLGRMIARFLDGVTASGVARRLVLYDNAGRTYYDSRPPAPPAHVADVLATGRSRAELIGAGAGEMVRVSERLDNRTECVRCHGDDSRVRGVVTVSLSTAMAADTRTRAMERRAWFTGYTLLGILVMLGGLLQYFVIRPVRRIGDVADLIGQGQLDVAVDRADPDGDEVARLGDRINMMVRGLRAKLNLEKMVSRGAAAAAATGVVLPSRGERRAFTVLFTDIRGFTAFSESVAPEVVVEVLNRFLGAQADVVHAFGGDIDKFVGDELMARFEGADAVPRAVRCAVAMIEAVQRVRRPGETLTIGAGVSSGDVVFGAIGHEDRIDVTVIGDVVNTGARLCAAAGPDEVLVAASASSMCGTLDDVGFVACDALTVKGKRQPLAVVRAVRRRE